MRRSVAGVAVAALVVLAAAACSGGPAGAGEGVATTPSGGTPAARPASPAPPVELTVFGAASLTDVLHRLSAAWEAANPGARIVVSTGSSAALATQIEQGAPADVFLSADTANAQRLVDDGFADGTAIVFAGNELALIVPAGNPAGISSPADLARPGVRIVAAGDEVPITRYASRLVANLGRLPGYPAGFAAAYAANVVSKEDDVRAIAAKIELGEGDAGIVYRTDAVAATGVRTIDVPAGTNVAASDAGVVVAGAADRATARAFMSWLIGPDGQAIMTAFGFTAGP